MSRRKKQISDINLKEVGGRIAYIRISNDQTIADVAKITGLSTGNLSGLENCKYEPSFQAIVKICEEYNVNPGWLLTGEGKMIRGEEKEVLEVKEESFIYKEGQSGPAGGMGIDQAVELLAKIYSSGNKRLIRAIIANLEAFGEVIESKEREAHAIQMMSEMNARMAALEKRQIKDVVELKAENADLKKRLDAKKIPGKQAAVNES